MRSHKHFAMVVIPTLVILSTLAGSRVAFSQLAQTTNGIGYLKSTQNADGSWGGIATSLHGVFPTTTAALEALRAIEATTSTNQTNAVAFLSSQNVSETPFLAARVVALNGGSVPADVDALLARQNTDGGWGTAEGFESNVLDTSLALLALKSANVNDTTVLTRALNYLIRMQNIDGGWPLAAGGESRIFYTGYSLQALNGFRMQFALSFNQSRAIAFLRGRQNLNGSYGSPAGTSFETAASLLAMFGSGSQLTPAENSALNFLTSSQQGNGSWADDAYSTALAVRALAFPRDSDADGMPDSFESSNGLNPNDPVDAGGDTDHDGLTNLQEFRQGTNLNNPDTDGDGVDDQTELFSGSDPRDPASHNRPPVITSQPNTAASEAAPYIYQVQSSDPDNDALAFVLLQAPGGMNISQTGLIEWTPASNQAGTFAVIVKASDGRGGQAFQQYRVTVLAHGIDLAVGDVNASAVTTDLQTLVIGGSVRVDIQNRGGTLFAGQFAVTLFEDRNNNGTYQSGIDNVLGTGAFSGGIDSNAAAPLDVRVSGVVQFRDNAIFAFVDSANQIPELDETNNVGSSGNSSKYRPPVNEFQPKVKWQYNQTGVDGPVNSPLVAPLIDTNGDGLINERDVPTVIFLTDRLTALRGDTGAVIFAITRPSGVSFAPYNDNLAVGDLDGDGVPEIIVPTAGGGVNCFNNNGTFRWTSSPSVTYSGSPTIVDLDGDGHAEILYGKSVFNFDGTVRWADRGLYRGGAGGAGRQAADLDLDGVPEIISGPAALDRDGNPIWFWQTFGNEVIGTLDRGQTIVRMPNSNITVGDGYTAIANLDDDPNPEVIVVYDGGNALWVFEHDGRIKPGFPVRLYQDVFNHEFFNLGPPTVAPFDPGGFPQIAISAARGLNGRATSSDASQVMMAVYERDGSLKWRRNLLPAEDTFSDGTSPAAAFDFDGDGAAEIVYQTMQKLHILNGRDGATLYEIGVGHGLHDAGIDAGVTPIIADVDNDGIAEIIVATKSTPDGSPPRSGVLVLGDTSGNWRNARRTWNQWLYHVTNVDEDGGIPQVATNNWQTLNNSRTQVSIEGRDRLAAPDLTVSKVTVNTQSCPAGVGITARIGNGGSLHVAAGQKVNFHSGDPLAGGVLIGTRQTTRALYPGEFEDVTLTGVAPPASQVFVTVGDPQVETLMPSSNLALLPHTWAQTSGYCPFCIVLTNLFAHRGIDGLSGTLWTQSGTIPTNPPFYEVHFQFPVNASFVAIHNAGNLGFLTGTLDFSNGFSTPFSFDSNGAGTISFPEQQKVSWIRLTGATTRPNGPSLTEFVVAGSYTEPQFRLNEGAGRSGNNKAASNFTGSPCDPAANQPPLIISAPPIMASMGAGYTYQVQASDPNNDPLFYSLTAAPASMTMSATGLISWTPADTQTGNFPVMVQVADGRGGFANQPFTIAVAPPSGLNSAPRITSTPQTSVALGQAYQYAVSATDPDGDTVLFALLQAPTGATIEQFFGGVSWTAPASQVGPQFFTVEAQDGRGGRTVQSFTVDVQPATASLPPQPQDADADGFDETEDCDDTNSAVNPAQAEIPGNGLDDDCNPATPDTLPANAVACSIVTDKRGYEASSLAQLTVTTRNVSANLSMAGLEAHVTVSDPGGQNVHTTTVPVNTLSPNGLFRATEGFNIETRPPRTYQANLELRFGSAMVCGSQAPFAVLSSAAQGKGLSGNITVNPAQIAQLNASLSYQVSNVGNVDLAALNLKILAVELPGGAVVRTLTDQTSLNKGQAFSNSQTFSVNGLRAGDYLAILQGESGGTTQTVNSAFFAIVNQPPVARCKDVTRIAVNTVMPQEVDDGSSDPEGSPLTLSLDPAGPYPLGTTAVNLTVTDDKGSSSQCTANVTINRGTPAISWNNPADISYGTVLGAGQLNATASFNGTEVPGTFSYTPGAGTVLSAANGQTLTVTFTPTDTTLYNEAISTVAINVLKATATVNVTGGVFTYDGQPHAATGTVTGVGGVDLGTATLAYDPGGSSAPVNAGSYAVTGSFGGDANYNSASALATITINKAPATISLSNLTQTYDGSPKSVNAATNPSGLSELSVTYDGSAAAPTNAGSYAVVATLTNDNYTAGTATGTLVIAKATSSIDWTNPADIVYGTPLAGVQLNATASVSGSFIYSPNAGTRLSAGNGQILTVSLMPDDSTNYNSANATVLINVLKATPTVNVTGGVFTYDGQPHPAVGTVTGVGGADLGTATLAYTPGGSSAPVNAGSYAVTGSFTGDANYNAASALATISINKAPATISLSNLTQAYDGSPKSATATTIPAGLSGVSITYDGSTTPPTSAGSYALVASLSNPNYEGPNVTASLVIIAPRRATNVAYTGSTMMAAGELTVLSAVLSDSSSSAPAPIGNRNVTLTLGGGASAQSCIGVTNSSGNVRCTIGAVNQPLGAGSVSARFDGDSNYLASTTSAPTWMFAGEACFLVDFREITYFRNTHVLTSSDADIRTRNGIAGEFDPSRWPYAPQGGSNKTRSRATLFRIYGFNANQVGVAIPNQDNPSLTYIVRADTEISGAYYIDLGGPARAVICPSQLQTHLIGEGEQIKPWTLPGTSPLTDAQKNVPGIMLTHNVAKVVIPERVWDELRALGMPLVDAQGNELQSGLVDYLGFQLWGHGNADYREFVDVILRYIFDDAADDRLQHYKFGFHTAKNGDLETFVGCHYLDHAPGDDAVRFNDVWAGRNQNNPQWGPACGSLEPLQNQKVRENYAVPVNGIQILPTVNTNDDTLRILFGRIRAPN